MPVRALIIGSVWSAGSRQDGLSLTRPRTCSARWTVWREETGEMHTPSARMHPLAVEPLTQATTGINREPIGALLAAVGFVLLIACANISTLLVVRAERRRADVAIQLALGASRRRLLADSLGEGLMLALAASLGGVALSHIMIRVLVAMWPTAANAAPALDYRVLGATAGVTAIAASSSASHRFSGWTCAAQANG